MTFFSLFLASFVSGHVCMFCVFYAFSYLFAPLVKESRTSSLTLPAFFFSCLLLYICVFFFFTPLVLLFRLERPFFLRKGKKKNTKFLSKEKVGVLQKKEKRRRKKKRGVFVVASKRCATLGAFMHLSGSTTQTFTVISVFFFVCFLRVFPMHPLPRVFSHLFRAAHLCVSTPPSLNPLPFSCFFLLLCFCSFTF